MDAPVRTAEASDAATELPPGEEEAAPWPDGATSVEIEKVEVADALPAAASSDVKTRSETKLPPLDSLVAQIPPAVREALDDLFRVKFVAVQRLAPATLKDPPPEKG